MENFLNLPHCWLQQKIKLFKYLAFLFLLFDTKMFGTCSSECEEICPYYFDEEPSCEWIVTRAFCSGGEVGYVEICFQSKYQGGNHLWQVTPGFGQTQTSNEVNPCFQFSVTFQNTIYYVVHTVSGSTSQDLVCALNVAVNCSPDCSIYNFQYTTNGCNITATINNQAGFNVAWDFGDGTVPIYTNSSSVTHKYPDLGGVFEVCLTRAFDAYFTCCYTVYIPPCEPCFQSDLVTEYCEDQSFPEWKICCQSLTFIHPFPDILSYTWDFGDNTPQVTTTTPSTTHNFIGEGPFNICITFSIFGQSYSCCYTKSFPECHCCETADFTINPVIVPNNPNCIQFGYELIPLCTREGLTEHEWIFEDGTRYFGTFPPIHYFTNFINDDGTVCVIHKTHCSTFERVVEKCVQIPKGVYIGLPGQVTRMTDVIDAQGTTVEDLILLHSNNPITPLLIQGELQVN